MGKIEFETTTCSVCGSAKCASWFTNLKDRWFPCEETFTLVRCNECGHVYQNPRPTMSTLRFCYPSDYQPYHPMRHGVSAMLKRWVLEREVRECVKHKSPPAAILEIGCAHGDFLEKLRTQGFKVAGVEFDEDVAKRARTKNLDVSAGTLREACLPSSSFDMVYMKHVIEHLPDVRETLAEVHRILKPGGYLLVATPNIYCPLVDCFGADALDFDIPRHLNLYSSQGLERQLREAGFAIASVNHDPVPNSWVRSCHLRLERYKWARAFFRLENPFALLLFTPLSGILALLRRSSRIRVWAKRHE